MKHSFLNIVIFVSKYSNILHVYPMYIVCCNIDHTTTNRNKPKMVERVKKFTDGILKNALEMKNEKGEERVTIVLASYQEGQVK